MGGSRRDPASDVEFDTPQIAAAARTGPLSTSIAGHTFFAFRVAGLRVWRAWLRSAHDIAEFRRQLGDCEYYDDSDDSKEYAMRLY